MVPRIQEINPLVSKADDTRVSSSKIQETKPQGVSSGTVEVRRVSFRPRAKTRRCLHLADYTESEIESTWLTDDEMDAIKENIRTTIRMIKKGELVDDTHNEEYCRLGLESRTRVLRGSSRFNNLLLFEIVC